MSAADRIKQLADTLGMRQDSWFNRFTGLGTLQGDRGQHTQFDGDAWLDDATLKALFYGDPLCRKIVSIYPKGALRRGWHGGERMKRLRAREKIQEAAIWGRLYGGAIVVMGVDDGRPMTEPLVPFDPKNPPGVCWLDVHDKREVFREQTVFDPSSSDWGDAQIFRVTPANGATYWVHRSRCLIFGGDITGAQEKRGRDGWDVSVLQAVYTTIRDFANGYLSIGNMLSDASQGVLKMAGLIKLMVGENDEVVRRRLTLIDLSRSVARSIFLDADNNESFEKVDTNFGGVADVVDRLWNKLSADTEIPVTILAGQAPAGLNATGELDLRSWYDSLEAYRRHEIEPQVAKLAMLVGDTVSWPSLWQETDGERALREKTEAEIDNIYLTAEVVTPEDVAERVRARYPKAALPVASAAPVPALPADDAVKHFAENLTKLQSAACEHGRSTRCWLCGVERERAVSRGADGKPVFGIKWRPIRA